MKSPGSEPTLDEFQCHLEAAMACGMITCGAWNAEVRHALDAVRAACPDPPKALIDAAMDAFLRQVMDPRPWWQQSDRLEL
jgi:hypothetical protein